MTIESDNPLVSTRWAQRLGRSLAADGRISEDALQDAWVAVLEGRMKHQASPGGWFRRVARNFALLGRRREEAVHRSERAAARPELQDQNPIDIVARAEVVQRVVSAVLELREPYRSTLLLRYLDELSAEEIAKRQGVPGSTVRNRLRRGLEEVRQRFGGKVPLWSLLLGWWPLADSLRTRMLEAWVVTKGTKVALVTVTTVAVGAWVWNAVGTEAAETGRAVVGQAASLEPSTAGALEAPAQTTPAAPRPEARKAVQHELAAEPAPKIASVPLAPEPARIFVRSILVVDLKNEPVPDARLEWEEVAGEERRVAELLTDALGRCELRHPEATLEVTAFKEEVGIARTQVPFSAEQDGAEVRLRLIEPIRLTGIVLDPEEHPVAGALVEPRMQGLILTEDLPFDTPALETDAEGRFEFLLHSNGVYLLSASYGEERSQAIQVSKAEGLEREVVLRLMGAHTIEGILFDPERTPVAGGRIQIFSNEPHQGLATFRTGTKSDEEGRFHFDLPGPGAFRLVGSAPRGIRTELDVDVGEGEASRSVELVLDPPESITGRVLWEDGRPAEGCRVEGWTEGNAMPSELGFVLDPSNASSVGYAVAVTDEEGRFELTPLRPDTLYSLALQPDPEKRARVRYHEIPSGTADLDLEVTHERLKGGFVFGSITSSLHPIPPQDLQIQLKWRKASSEAPTALGSWHADRPRQRLDGTGPWRAFDGSLAENRYEYAYLIPGRQYVLYFTAPGHGTTIVGPWIASEEGTRIDVVLDERLDLSVEVLRADGYPAAHAATKIDYRGNVEVLHIFGERYTDDAGALFYEDMLAGEYEITAVYKGKSIRETVHLRAGSPQTRAVLRLAD